MLSGQDGFLKVGRYSIHYVRWGSRGGNVVLLHSMGLDAHSMDLLSESLSGDHRILALTILGHGDSTIPTENVSLPDHAELMRECIMKLGFKPFILIGHSIGGRMGMILAAEHPEEVSALILVDIAPPDPMPGPWRMEAPSMFKDREDAMAYLKGRYPKFANEYYENRLRYGFVKQPDGSLKPKPVGNDKMRSISTDLWPYVARIKIPTLLVIGAESTLVTPEKLARMKKEIKDLTVVKIDGATHMVPQDKPAEFERAVRGFLSKIS